MRKERIDDGPNEFSFSIRQRLFETLMDDFKNVSAEKEEFEYRNLSISKVLQWLFGLIRSDAKNKTDNLVIV